MKEGAKMFISKYYEKSKVYSWELKHIENWTIEEIKNRIWKAAECGQPVPGCVSVDALRLELLRRGEESVGYHNS